MIEADPIMVEEKRKQSKIFLPPVDGYKADETTGVTRTALPITETPSSIGVVTRDIIKDTFSLRQQDAFEHVSGVSRSNTRILRDEGFNIRGFQIGGFSGMRQNGLPIEGNFSPEVALVERYEIIKGPASIVGGASSPGGFVNRITKRPENRNFATSQFQAGSFGLYRGVADANGVLPENNNVRGRLIFAVEEGGNYVDEVDVRQYTVAPSLQMDLFNGAGTLFLTGHYQKFDGSSTPGFPILPTGKAPDIPRTRNFGGGSATGAETTFEGQNIEAHYVHEFINNLTLTMRGKYSHSDSLDKNIYGWGLYQDGDSYYSYMYGSLRLNDNETYAGEVFLSKEFEVLGQNHEVLLGVDHRDMRQDFRVGYQYIGTDNIFDPAHELHLPAIEELQAEAATRPYHLYLKQTGLFGQVVARPVPRLTLVGAFRQDWAYNRDRNPGSDADPTAATHSALTGRVGATYELVPGVYAYGGISQSFQVNFSALTMDGSGLPPETGDNYEVGAKLELVDGRLLITTALFRSFRQNVATTDPDNPNFSIAVGEQRHQGVEFDINGQPWPGLNLTGNVSYIDSKVTKDNRLPVGTPPGRAPRGYLGKVFATYELQTGVLQGFGIGGGAFFHSGYELFRGNKTDPWERVDAIVFYRPPQKAYDFTINVRNLLDATYLENPGQLSGYNSFGAPATVVGTLRVTF